MIFFGTFKKIWDILCIFCIKIIIIFNIGVDEIFLWPVLWFIFLHLHKLRWFKLIHINFKKGGGLNFKKKSKFFTCFFLFFYFFFLTSWRGNRSRLLRSLKKIYEKKYFQDIFQVWYEYKDYGRKIYIHIKLGKYLVNIFFSQNFLSFF